MTNVDIDGMLCAAMVNLAGVPVNDAREIAPVWHWGLCVPTAGSSAIASQALAGSAQTTAGVGGGGRVWFVGSWSVFHRHADNELDGVTLIFGG